MAFIPKILVVEDDEALLHLLGAVLRQLGAEPHLLASSLQAAELIKQAKFDGVFLDWKMPEMDGLELTRRIRHSQPNAQVPIIMLTGLASSLVLKDAFEAGVNFFLQKPVSLARLSHLLDASRGLMLQERRRYQRAPVQFSVRVEWEGGRAEGHSVNLGADGILMSLRQLPPEGVEVSVEFELPEVEYLKIPGSVARMAAEPAPGETEGYAVAVAFRHTQTHVRVLVTEFVDKTLAALPPG